MMVEQLVRPDGGDTTTAAAVWHWHVGTQVIDYNSSRKKKKKKRLLFFFKSTKALLAAASSEANIDTLLHRWKKRED